LSNPFISFGEGTYHFKELISNLKEHEQNTNENIEENENENVDDNEECG